jgi:hypothetical protein
MKEIQMMNLDQMEKPLDSQYHTLIQQSSTKNYSLLVDFPSLHQLWTLCRFVFFQPFTKTAYLDWLFTFYPLPPLSQSKDFLLSCLLRGAPLPLDAPALLLDNYAPFTPFLSSQPFLAPSSTHLHDPELLLQAHQSTHDPFLISCFDILLGQPEAILKHASSWQVALGAFLLYTPHDLDSALAFITPLFTQLSLLDQIELAFLQKDIYLGIRLASDFHWWFNPHFISELVSNKILNEKN